MNLTNEVLDAVKKNLPQVVAGELADYIKQSEKLKSDFEALTIQHNSLQNKYEAGDKKYNKLKEENEWLLVWKSRFEEIEEREKELALTIANSQRDEAIKRSDDIFNLANIVFKNPRLTYQENSSHTPSREQYGNVNPAYTNKTTTVEEIK